MDKLLLNKISYLVKSSINEAFDFDGEFEDLNDTGSINVIAADMLQGFDLYAIREENAKIPFNEIFLALYKCKLPFANPASSINIPNVGPLLYYRKQYDDINKLLIIPNTKYSYSSNQKYYENRRRRDWRPLIQQKWQWHCSKLCQDYMYQMSKENANRVSLDKNILEQLKVLGENIGIHNMENYANPNFPHFVSFFVSPDNGIVIIDTIAHADASHDSRYNNGYFNTSESIYSNMVFYSGLIKYEKNTQAAELNKAQLKEEQILTGITDRLFRLIRGTYWERTFKEPHNVMPHIILDDNDHYVLPLGDKFFTYTSDRVGHYLWGNAQPPVGRPPRLASDLSFNAQLLQKAQNEKHYFIKWLFSDIKRIYDWKVIYAKPSLVVYEHKSYSFLKAFITPKENVIEKLFGTKILGLCKEGRDIIIKECILEKNLKLDLKIYGVLWCGEEINDLVEAILNRKTSLKAFRKAVTYDQASEFLLKLQYGIYTTY